MEAPYQRKYLPFGGLIAEFDCHRDSIFEAAYASSIGLWAIADKWQASSTLNSVKNRLQLRGRQKNLLIDGYVKLLPKDTLIFRTHDFIDLQFAETADRALVKFTQKHEVRDGALFVLAKEAESCFEKRKVTLGTSPPLPATSPKLQSKPIGEVERNNLECTIGALTLFIADKKGMMHGDSPNKNLIARRVDEFLKDNHYPIAGLGVSALEQRLAAGLERLSEKRKKKQQNI